MCKSFISQISLTVFQILSNVWPQEHRQADRLVLIQFLFAVHGKGKSLKKNPSIWTDNTSKVCFHTAATELKFNMKWA